MYYTLHHQTVAFTFLKADSNAITEQLASMGASVPYGVLPHNDSVVTLSFLKPWKPGYHSQEQRRVAFNCLPA